MSSSIGGDSGMIAPSLQSVLRCPACGFEELFEMPTDSCRFLHACAACGVVLRPRPGDCCVFCSFGSIPCPPVQLARASRGE